MFLAEGLRKEKAKVASKAMPGTKKKSQPVSWEGGEEQDTSLGPWR